MKCPTRGIIVLDVIVLQGFQAFLGELNKELNMRYLTLFMLGCVVHVTPYVAEFNVGDHRFHGTATKALRVYNPTANTVDIKVVCSSETNLFEGEPDHWFTVKPDDFSNALIEVPAHYQSGNACRVSDWNVTGN